MSRLGVWAEIADFAFQYRVEVLLSSGELRRLMPSKVLSYRGLPLSLCRLVEFCESRWVDVSSRK